MPTRTSQDTTSPRRLPAVGDVVVDLDQRHGPFPGTLDRESISRYAAATNDTDPPLAGDAVPPTYPVILVFDAQYAANAVVPPRGLRVGPQRCARRARHPPAPPARTWRVAHHLVGAVRDPQHPCGDACRAAHGAVRRQRPVGRRAVVDDLLRRERPPRRRRARARRTTRFPRRRGRTGSGPRRNTWTSTRPRATRKSRTTGRRTTSIWRWRGVPGSTTCSPTDSARWRCAARP